MCDVFHAVQCFITLSKHKTHKIIQNEKQGDKTPDKVSKWDTEKKETK